MVRAIAMGASMLLAVGCGPGERNYYEGDGGIEDLDNGPHPLILVDPDRVDFGTVEVDDGVEHVEVVNVYNIGEADLHIQNLEVENPDHPFMITAIQSVLISPDESTSFEVIFQPEQEGSWQGVALLDSDDPTLPVLEIVLLGEGVAAAR